MKANDFFSANLKGKVYGEKLEIVELAKKGQGILFSAKVKNRKKSVKLSFSAKGIDNPSWMAARNIIGEAEAEKMMAELQALTELELSQEDIDLNKYINKYHQVIFEDNVKQRSLSLAF